MKTRTGGSFDKGRQIMIPLYAVAYSATAESGMGTVVQADDFAACMNRIGDDGRWFVTDRKHSRRNDIIVRQGTKRELLEQCFHDMVYCADGESGSMLNRAEIDEAFAYTAAVSVARYILDLDDDDETTAADVADELVTLYAKTIPFYKHVAERHEAFSAIGGQIAEEWLFETLMFQIAVSRKDYKHQLKLVAV